jgi:hypothetical protein
MAEQESGTKATPTSEKDNLLQKIAAVDKEHASITDKLAAIKAPGVTTDAAAWTAFGDEVDTASANLKEAMKLLETYQPQTVTEENVNDESTNDTFSDYKKLYQAITEALVDTQHSKTKSDVDTTSFQSLIFTQGFITAYPDSNNESNPINLFIMAIKNYSYNSNANKINPTLTIAKELDNNLNHDLLKAVLDALSPTNVTTYLSSQKPKSLDVLLKTLTRDLSTPGETNSLTTKIKELFAAPTSSQGGGGSSSSSSSKKNRKSHKSYHPDIGKTRKHHSHTEPKRVSFVHQA